RPVALRARRAPALGLGGRPAGARELLVHDARETLVGLGPHHQAPVYEERRRRGDAVALPFGGVLLPLAGVAARPETRVELGGVESARGRAGPEGRLPETRL